MEDSFHFNPETFLKPTVCLDISFCSRLKWQKIRALQLFTEHVLLNHGNLIMYARRLNLVSSEYWKHVWHVCYCFTLMLQGLGEETNFLEYSTLDKVKRVLNNMLIKEHK